MAGSQAATSAPHPQKKNTKKALLTTQKCIILLENKKENESRWVRFFGCVSYLCCNCKNKTNKISKKSLHLQKVK